MLAGDQLNSLIKKKMVKRPTTLGLLKENEVKT
jgi:hypothetical protein